MSSSVDLSSSSVSSDDILPRGDQYKLSQVVDLKSRLLDEINVSFGEGSCADEADRGQKSLIVNDEESSGGDKLVNQNRVSLTNSLTDVNEELINEKNNEIGRVTKWATGFERLLEDPLGLQIFTTEKIFLPNTAKKFKVMFLFVGHLVTTLMDK
ncbi:hypothetical protein BpHYR1_051349 [Brachionus plicatilis]|uniref:Uncharacterized protein n=1 Tax=Brachionus plicatilis TaxID=10195 RepID=A0A3M7PXD4_BRAPC|nr:hypothetical protein BpHYR1_051349 [Brachionus plicatilis]